MILRLPSTNKGIAALEGYVKQLVEHHKLSPDLYPNILISLTEAVNNAIKHGNHNDTTKVVCVRSWRDERRLCCIVSDEGTGFDFNKLPDPTRPENIDKDGGRGVFLMRQLSDSVRFLKNGSTVEIEFYV